MDMSTHIHLDGKLNVNRITPNHDAEIPNNETINAINEVQNMKIDTSLGKTYTDINTMMNDLLK